ncbi:MULTISPECIES: response regulator [Nosocomiicoccus]|uniref:Response regulator transcription factor n=1 Tax=Nosocomiicoccus massiliensis TaxID=1232430 RepID=A0AAF0YN27_9STAP|nr:MULTISPECIES: response regulator transcription factor [Nosocomiicoccus]MDK6863527.1 response regulator transcription factor [Nosocomiicoccus ampullae]OFL46375.1 DNA-binding response regulator [Nosocomiicoccus sp. HMSC067E10]OFO52225.1 DNA-binding response regulator [Nosocomiicoccus sp. HMSC059G07]OFS64615.1 DNA-binding response regulator [Nosocomiicoccus sp. HMSC09A07]WOS96809.1 response regulator transcription factor [Nosocomiicoccus massiliensis]
MNIVITDDHAVVREGMKFLLSTTEDLKVVKDVDSGAKLIQFLEDNHKMIDLVLLDLVMPEMDGMAVLEIVKRDFPKLKVVILTSYTSEEYVRPALNKKADGYLIKEMDADDLIESLRRVANGDQVIHPDVELMLSKGQLPHQKNVLSTRELEVLKEMVLGKSNKEIAETLFVSEKTVKTHVSHILNKLEVSDRTQAVVYAIRHHIINL